MKSKDDVLMEKTMKLIQISAICKRQMVKCPADVTQASLKSLATSILNIIEGADE